MERHNYISSWKCTQIPAKTVKRAEKFEKNIRFPHNIAHLIVEDGSQRRARQTRRTFTANCSQISFCNWGECIFFHCCLPAKIFLFWISLVSQFCLKLIAVINQAPRHYTLSAHSIYLITIAAARIILPPTRSRQANETTCHIKEVRTNINQQNRITINTSAKSTMPWLILDDFQP